jgi:hypothetical protein
MKPAGDVANAKLFGDWFDLIDNRHRQIVHPDISTLRRPVSLGDDVIDPNSKPSKHSRALLAYFTHAVQLRIKANGEHSSVIIFGQRHHRSR